MRRGFCAALAAATLTAVAIPTAGGSAIVMWDSGTPAPPITNTPNRAGDDPHDNVRATHAARVQKSEFLKLKGQVVDVCDGKPCQAVP